MGRRRRPNLPGGTFHLTARTQGREPLFPAALRTRLIPLLRDVVGYSDVELFAYVFMPNHLHLVVRQGNAPLHRFMQPLLRRMALLVQKSRRREGHVFERRYRDHLCGSPGHLRNAIVYTHLNPVRAGLVARPEEYAWSSHRAWTHSGPAADGRLQPTTLHSVAQVFASAPDRTTGELRADYLAFQEWRRSRDRIDETAAEAKTSEVDSPEPPQRPSTAYGDRNWGRLLAPPNGRLLLASSWPGRPSLGAARPDLGNIARSVLSECEPGLMASQVRSRRGGRAYVRARHRIIRRASAAGYRGVEIAAYLRISATAVSDVLVASRKQLVSGQVDQR